MQKIKCDATHKLYENLGMHYYCPICGADTDKAKVEFVSASHCYYYDSYDYMAYVKCRVCGKRYAYLDGN